MRSTLFLCAITALPALARADDPQDLPPIPVVQLDRKEPVYFEKDIQPILKAKCMTCHSGNVLKGKLNMGAPETLFKGGRSGPALVPGKSAESLMVKLAGRNDKPPMPPKGETPLTPEELALLKLWIDQGAKSSGGGREKVQVVVGLPPERVHPVRALAISPDKSMLAASRGNQVHVYDAGSGTYIRSLAAPGLVTPDKKPVKAAHLSLVESVAFSPDGKYIASGSFQEVCLWDSQTGQLRQKLGGFADRVVALAFSPDGKLLATGGGAPTEDGEIKILEVPSLKVVTDIKNGHSDTVFGVCFSPDGKMLATGAADKFVKVFEVPTGKFLKAFEGHTHHVLDVGWKGDGKLLASASADNTVKIWDFATGEQARTIPAHGKQVTRLLFRGNTAEFITVSGDQTVRMWNADNGGNVRNFGGNSDFLYAVGITPDGAIVAAGGEEGTVRLYNGANGQLVKSLLPPGVGPPEAKK